MLVVTFRFRQPFLVGYRGTPTSSFSLSALLVAGSRTLVWLVANLCHWASSPGLSCCFTMWLRCADWLSLWLCVHSLLGCRVSWPSCRSFALQLALVFQSPVSSLLPYGSHSSRWGHPCGVEAGLSSIGTMVCVFPFRGFLLLLVTTLGVLVTIWVSVLVGSRLCTTDDFSWCYALSPSGCASSRCLWLRGGFLVVLAVEESLRLSLALSSVFPCPLFWLHVCLHGTGSGP